MTTKHNYYSLKGKIYIFERDANGKPINGEYVGITDAAGISMTREVLEKYTSDDYTNSLIAEEEKSKKATLEMTLASFAAKNLARVLYGTVVAQEAGSVNAENLGAFAAGESKALAKVGVSDVVLTAGGAALVEGVDYTISGKTGLITALVDLVGVSAAYAHTASEAIGMFTHSGKEYFVRFDAETSDGSVFVVEVPRWKPNPATNLGLKSQDFANFQISGPILADETITNSPLGKFARVYRT